MFSFDNQEELYLSIDNILELRNKLTVKELEIRT